MSEFNIIVESGETKRLLTSGKYCDRDILVTAQGGGSDGQIPEGYIKPSGTLEIAENGTHDVTEFASAEVNVQPVLQEKTVTENGEYVADDNFYGLSKVIVNVASIGGGSGDLDAFIDGSITEVTSNATSIKIYAFYNCKNLTNVNLPLATTASSGCFTGCSQLTNVNLPLVKTLGNGMFQSCSKLTSVNFPLVSTVDASAFNGCTSLFKIDFSIVKALNGSYIFNACANLKAVVIRSTTMCTLSSSNVFMNCYHILGTQNTPHNPNGDKDGYIYVPRALIEDYKVATNWTTYASQFRALEDYTVDGTTTGELDATKI